MKQTQLIGIATQYIRQVYLEVLDFTYEDKYDSITTRGRNIMDVSKDLQSIRQIPFADGSHFMPALHT